MWLLIDDQRPGIGWDVIARNPLAARELLLDFKWDVISFDHDLGQNVENGYELLKWAFECVEMPKRIQLVTANPVGRVRMATFLEERGYTTKNNVDYYAAEQTCSTEIGKERSCQNSQTA